MFPNIRHGRHSRKKLSEKIENRKISPISLRPAVFFTWVSNFNNRPFVLKYVRITRHYCPEWRFKGLHVKISQFWWSILPSRCILYAKFIELIIQLPTWAHLAPGGLRNIRLNWRMRAMVSSSLYPRATWWEATAWIGQLNIWLLCPDNDMSRFHLPRCKLRN